MKSIIEQYNSLKEQFVSHIIAKDLKELGFNEYCFGYYYASMITGKILLEISIKEEHKNRPEFVLAPVYQQVVVWLQKKYNIEIYCPNYYKQRAIEIGKPEYKIEYECRVNGRQISYDIGNSIQTQLFASYYDALNCAIEYALKTIKE